MSEEFSPLRSTSSRKPWPDCPDVRIYRCETCGRLFQDLSRQTGAEPPDCCAAGMVRLVPSILGAGLPGLDVEYKIVGGFNNSAVQVFWKTETPQERPEWIMLKTFTGGYIKYVGEKKNPPLVFPLSDEDAYVYCDRQECERCVFRCKLGFVLYLYFVWQGLVEVPLDRMSEYFKSGR